MAHMSEADRQQLCRTLRFWLDRAQAGVQCCKKIQTSIAALITAPTDQEDQSG